MEKNIVNKDENGSVEDSDTPQPWQLPADLPTSLDDRRPASYQSSVEVYDAWQGQSHFVSAPAISQPINFNLALNDTSDDIGYRVPTHITNDRRLEEMKAARAAHEEEGSHGNEQQVISNERLSKEEKRIALQGSLHMAASSGDLEKLQKLLVGPAQGLVDVNAPDEEGTAPIIYASCFGHEQVVEAFLASGAKVDAKDRHGWTALTWATANGHGNIVQMLLRHGASRDTRSSSGRTPADFAAPDSNVSDYFHDSAYSIGSTGISDDFYSKGLSQDRFEEEMAENEMRRRMMMESARNLEVDLGNLGLDEQPETPEEQEAEQEDFIWDRCLNDQMLVFQEADLDRLLDTVITKMSPQRSPTQKPIPANVLFLSARYAHYHANMELLHSLLISAMERINDVVEKMQGDMTILAFWMSNATLLLHYLKKDTGLIVSTADIQVQLADLINEIFVLVIRDAERRMDKILDPGMLEFETIAGFEDVQFQNEWKFFKRAKTKVAEPSDKQFRPPSPRQRAKVSPRNTTSLLSSTLFVLDLYDIHSVIIVQILGQLLYWLGAEIFNRVMSNRKYLSRTKALQIRMNVSVIEDWAQNNNRYPEHYENGETTTTGFSVLDSAKHHLAPVKQLLEWLQVCSSLSDNVESLKDTVHQLPRLSPQQLLHAVKYYRAEVGEKSFSKAATKVVTEIQKDAQTRRTKQQQDTSRPQTPTSSVSKPRKSSGAGRSSSPVLSSPVGGPDDDYLAEHTLLDPALMLPFHLPTSTDMLISYGAGLGGINRERAQKYIPTIPPELLTKFDMGDRSSANIYRRTSWSNDDD